MKGIVFTEFIEFVESTFDIDTADEIIESSDLPSGGVYTAVGTYDHAEIVSLVMALAKRQNLPPAALIKAFGTHLFGRFAIGYPALFENQNSAFEFLLEVDNYIHVEVRKLYPDAELPTIEYNRPEPDCLEMMYRSRRPFADLAEGLICGCIEYFKEVVEVNREDLEGNPGTAAKFTLIRGRN